MFGNTFSRRRRSKFLSRTATTPSAVSSTSSSGSSSSTSALRSYGPSATVNLPIIRSSSSSSSSSSTSNVAGRLSGSTQQINDEPSAASTSAIFKIRGGVFVATASTDDDDQQQHRGGENIETSKTSSTKTTADSSSSSSSTAHRRRAAAAASAAAVSSGSLAGAEDEYEEAEREFFHHSSSLLVDQEQASAAATGMTNDDLCSGFESQTWRKDRCKKCFRFKEQHSTGTNGGASSSKYANTSSSSSSSSNVASRVNKFLDKTTTTGTNGRSEINESPPSSSSDWRRRVYGNASSSIENSTSTSSNGRTSKLTNVSSDELLLPTPTQQSAAGSFSVMSSKQKEDDKQQPTTAAANKAADAQEDSSAKRKTKLLLIKAEVSFDGRPSEPIDVETTPTSPEPPQPPLSNRPSASSSLPSSLSKYTTSTSTTINRRPQSPMESYMSVRSGASSAADSYETAQSGGGGGMDDPLSRTVSYESVASTLMDAGSMITAASGRSNSVSERSSTPTESLDTDTQSFMRSIKAQLEIMENKCAKLEDENAKLRKKGSPYTTVSASDSEMTRELKEKLNLAESLCQDYRDENTVLKCELRDLQELTSRHANYADLKEWRQKLKAAESLCEELMDENETVKKDLRDAQQEIDEMHDQYREEEIEEFRELQRELEQTAKNCRILQFKLRKSERRHDQTEADRQHLESKLKELLNSSGGSSGNSVLAAAALESPRLRELESELRIAKEVSVRLHNELETLDEKRCKLEDENFYLKEKVRELETREKLMEQMRVRQELKRTGSGSSTGKPSHLQQNANQQQQHNNGQQGGEMQLLRDLQDALERETDLREQMRFAEEDIQAARKKLADLETENEGLMRQLAKFTNTGGLSGRGKPPMKRSFSEGHAQIELELAEHEATVLKDRLSRMEKDSEKMVSQISLLEKELKKVGGKTEFADDELRDAIPDTYYKQKIKMLEEEVEDLKKKLEDARRPESEQRMPQSSASVSKSSVSISSSAMGGGASKNVDVQRQLSLVEQEVSVLRQRIADLEMESDRLNSENKRLSINSKKVARTEKSSTSSSSASPTSSTGGGGQQERIEQMEKDIHRFINRCAELEREKEALNKEIERRKKLETIKKETTSIPNAPTRFNPNTASVEQLRTKVTELIKDNSLLGINLKGEEQKTVELEAQLSDYKQVIGQSDDQKVIVMASKVEALTTQLREAQNRIDMGNYQTASTSQIGGDRKYEEMLKERIDILERALADEKAKSKSMAPGSKEGSIASIGDSSEKEVLAAELSSCYQMLSTVEDQVDRIYKQIEQLEQKQQPEKSPSTQPKSTASTASIRASPAEKEKLLKDIASMKTELDSLRAKLQDRRKSQTSSIVAASSSSTSSSSTTISKTSASPMPNDVKQLQSKCHQQETSISELKEQLEHASREKVNAQKHNEIATTRLLQTEERWNKELEKLKESYENQVKDLKYYLQEAERNKEENSQNLQERSSALQEKSKRNQELETKMTKMEQELKTRHKDLQDRVEVEKKRAKEFETKYQKLETLYESDRQKLNTEKEKFKTDLTEIKKRYDETQNDFEKLKSTYDRKEQIWQKERSELDTQVKRMQSEIGDVEKKTARKAAEMASAENRKLLSEMSSLKRRIEADSDSWKTERVQLQQTVEQRTKDLDDRSDELERFKKEMTSIKSRVSDQKQQLDEARRMRDESREELNRWQQTWARERSELSHKLRQEEKVQQAEHQALQLKYESRIKVMEDSNKRNQAQLSQSRRERDAARDNLAASEKKVTELRQKYENDEKELRQRMLRMENEVQGAEDLKVELEKERVESKAVSKNYETDKRLWNVEREQFLIKINELEKASGRVRTTTSAGPNRSPVAGQTGDKEKALGEAIDIATQLRKQLGDVKSSYDEQVAHLHKNIETHRQDWSKERTEMNRKLKELQDSTKILEIDRRNFLSSKDQNESDKTALQTERDSLTEKLHDNEIHQLANKYKLDKVADQITDLQSKIRYGDWSTTDRRDMGEAIRKALDQLLAVREDMAKTKEFGKAFDSLDIPDDAASVSSFRSSNGSTTRKMSSSVVDVESVDQRDAGGSERLAPPSTDGKSSQQHKSYGSASRRSDLLAAPNSLSIRSTSGDSSSIDRPGSFDKSRSGSGEMHHGSSSFEARMAELRLRSPSPSPRKVTNYPEAPPSMVLNSRSAVEYDSSGRRHWTRRSLLKRSTSFDPTAPNVDSGLESLMETTDGGLDSPMTESLAYPGSRSAHPRSISAGGDGAGFISGKASSSLGGSEGGESGSELGSARSQSPSRRRAADIFATIRKSATSQAAKAKRGLFATKKAASIETSEIGHRIGAIGVQVLPPAIALDALPDSMRTASETSLDEPPKPISKSSSGTSIFARLRNRSSSRGPSLKKGQSMDEPTSVDVNVTLPTPTPLSSRSYHDQGSTKSVPGSSTTAISASTSGDYHSSRTTTATITTRPSASSSSRTGSISTSVASKYRPSTEDTSVTKIRRYPDSSVSSSTSTSTTGGLRSTLGFRRLSTSYSSVRSLSNKYLHRW